MLPGQYPASLDRGTVSSHPELVLGSSILIPGAASHSLG